MWKMRLIKSVEFYRKDKERPWRISLLMRGGGELTVEISSPAADIDKVRFDVLNAMDYLTLVDMLHKAIMPDRVKRSVEKGWM